nr:type ISP restriction/modification enzyme [Ornithinimicrobium sp. INDO-MA30-4]
MVVEPGTKPRSTQASCDREQPCRGGISALLEDGSALRCNVQSSSRQTAVDVPHPNHPNYGFVVMGPGNDKPFSTHAVDALPDLGMWGSGPSQFFARYTYEAVASDTLEFSADVVDGYRRIDNITDATLKEYRTWYGNDVTKDDVFAFIYGFLHSPDYRTRFAADLNRSLPRIPRIDVNQFPTFRDAGEKLLGLHIDYENVEPYPIVVDGIPEGLKGEALYDALRVQKMKYGKQGKEKDQTVIHYSPSITISGLPEEAQRYMLGSRSGLDWIIDRYQVKVDKPSGIVNDPNDWSREMGNPRYILDLIAKVTTVSVETMKIVDSLPDLEIVED